MSWGEGDGCRGTGWLAARAASSSIISGPPARREMRPEDGEKYNTRLPSQVALVRVARPPASHPASRPGCSDSSSTRHDKMAELQSPA